MGRLTRNGISSDHIKGKMLDEIWYSGGGFPLDHLTSCYTQRLDI
jgi:hypothetical protein